MPLVDVDLAFVRNYVVWTPPTDDDLSARFDLLYQERIRNPYREFPDPILFPKQLRVDVATAFVRARLMQMLDEPDAFTTEDYSESFRGNPQNLLKVLDELKAMSEGEGFSIGILARVDGDPFRSRIAGEPDIDPYRALRNRGFGRVY